MLTLNKLKVYLDVLAVVESYIAQDTLMGTVASVFKGQIKDNKRLAFIYKTSTVNE